MTHVTRHRRSTATNTGHQSIGQKAKEQNDIAAIAREVLLRNIAVRTGDRVRLVPKIEAAFEAVLEKALQGDFSALGWLITCACGVNATEQSYNEHRDQEAKQQVLAMLEQLGNRMNDPSRNEMVESRKQSTATPPDIKNAP